MKGYNAVRYNSGLTKLITHMLHVTTFLHNHINKL